MINFIWFDDGKLLKFYHCNHKNRPKQSFLRICGDSLTFAADCSFQQNNAPTHESCEMVEFLVRQTSNF